ncbi:NAD(P)-dependent oxidoreductase [Xanthobacter versatilis]|uniref:NAD(P)-dependent oxidoreductase n=1 Tax=Xanthobacter autotrophicus (strain ATCC BAA-1158 / Py2) TaxID=78245 RepID=UPI0037285C52
MGISIIGLGEVGRCYAQALRTAGLALEDAVESRPSSPALSLVREEGIRLHDSNGPWLSRSDIVISAVTGEVALSVARSAFPFLSPGAVYADFTTARPDDMRLAAKEAQDRGILFVDVAIMGGITLAGAQTPLLCAGDGAERLAEALAPLGGRIRVLADGAPGDAVTLKLLRSIFVKGMEALAVECLTLAQSAGLKAKLYDNLVDVDEAHLPDFLDMLVRTHVIHAARRLHEVESAEAQLEAAGFSPLVTAGVKATFDRSRKAVEGRVIKPDITVAEALEILIDSARTDLESKPAA